ncbi:MAG: L-2-hydroxyglutarate oxidase LhgO [Verrucomicrobia subdivision 3 bacterium]|nr:L-2-hydroxyglutarate oxidase LhgO [Limisphaerales bacterium]MCS1415437.1 L-2-hydroxyglutarate oxidase LhgO [Limisphaerales bacterium]
MPQKRLIIIGAGILGLATAYKCRKLLPSHRITIIEKESLPGRHQSAHNSGVLHCGLHYKPRSLKARLALSGAQEMMQFCRRHGIGHQRCGKIVVATDQTQIDRLKALQRQGWENGLSDLRLLDQSALRKIEPHAAGTAALHVPQEGIVDYASVVRQLAQDIRAAGHQIRCGEKVTIIKERRNTWLIQTPKNEYLADFLVACAGLHSDRLSLLSGAPPRVKIIPFRGEYYRIRPERQHLVRHLIYPVPDPRFPFLGPHFTRLIHGGVKAGPNAALALAREGYRKTDFNLAEAMDAATFPGLWRFVKNYPQMTLEELRQSFSKRRFCQSLQRLVPEIQADDLAPEGAGVRAQAMSREGALVQDFEWEERKNALHVINAPSPGASASLALGGEIAARAKQQLANR